MLIKVKTLSFQIVPLFSTLIKVTQKTWLNKSHFLNNLDRFSIVTCYPRSPGKLFSLTGIVTYILDMGSNDKCMVT